MSGHARLQRSTESKVIGQIGCLASNPRPAGTEKLVGDDKYRIRHGTYRVVHEIDDKVVMLTVVKVAHRRDVHR